MLAPLLAATAAALEIETVYYPPGESIPAIGEAGAQPGNTTGGGELESIVRAAADVWEGLIRDEHRLVLHYGWYNTGSLSNSAYHVSIGWSGSPLREVSGSLAFNNGEDGYEIFLDPTPETGEEFRLSERAFSDFGTGPVEDTRRYTAIAEEAASRNDLFTAALHEIGHAVGLTRSLAFQLETTDGDIDIRLDGYEGATLEVQGAHLASTGALLSSSRLVGERRGVTQADLLAVCQLSGFRGCVLDAGPLEEAGDFNGDGFVDAADYVALRNADHHGPTEAQMELWNANYGVAIPTADGAGWLTTPEPGAGLLAALSALAIIVRCRTGRPCGRA